MKKRAQCALALLIILFSAVPAMTSGYSGEKRPEGGSEVENLIICTEPRPQICTMDYRPVCAQLGDGTLKTYSNGCTACSDPAVKGHREGACE